MTRNQNAKMMMAFVLTCAIFIFLPQIASASILQQTCEVIETFVNWLKTAVYSLSAISLVFISFKASATGDFSFSNLISWGVALFFVSMTGPLLLFLTGDANSATCVGIT